MIQILLIASTIAAGACAAMGAWTGVVLMAVFAVICAQDLLVQRHNRRVLDK